MIKRERIVHFSKECYKMKTDDRRVNEMTNYARILTQSFGGLQRHTN